VRRAFGCDRTLFTGDHFHGSPAATRRGGHARLLSARGFTLWDIQALSPHTARFGAFGLPPHEYRRRLAAAVAPALRREGSSSRI